MREAFVLTLGDGTDAGRRSFVGWIEHVDTGRECRFRSPDELMSFLADCVQQKPSEATDDDKRDQ